MSTLFGDLKNRHIRLKKPKPLQMKWTDYNNEWTLLLRKACHIANSGALFQIISSFLKTNHF